MSSVSTTRRNRAAVLAAARAAGESSRAELAEATGLSIATVSRAAAALIDAGLLVEHATVGPAGGRPLGRVRVAAGAALVLAVDVADHHTTLSLVDLDGAVRWSERLDDPPEGPEERLAHTLEATTGAFLVDRDGRMPVAVGVAIPGPVQTDGTVDFAPALHWHGVRLGELLRERLGAPVAVGNDANLIAVAESRWGAQRGASSLMALAVFEGVGAGIVEAGRIVEGSRGFAGQIGRMLVGPDSIDRQQDDFGDLESQLGSAGLVRRAAEAGVALPPDAEPFAALFAHLGDRSAAGALAERVLDEFAVALANVCALLDPEAIVLAGRFAPLAGVVGPELERRLTGRVLHLPALVPASTPVDGALLGAAAIAIDAFGPLEQLLDREVTIRPRR
ncbi:ROK family transcriptional regulator [Agrococcus carbonis]|uniref:Sugar kinase of the NBD/HSP70 family, may contain an N-terminal HTH domain n=1 Tax=Agrococcus carbonis TaxID=684552 RepID=A0A1H1KW81_9MICO|nr:ROK family transcriptional regulator [Agrococcus carbonis]SDR66262.1 Sugar kinase of the NBD/HSP70 family, may contain an N-terminal HTH domain [Agrococcus carbonis]